MKKIILLFCVAPMLYACGGGEDINGSVAQTVERFIMKMRQNYFKLLNHNTLHHRGRQMRWL